MENNGNPTKVKRSNLLQEMFPDREIIAIENDHHEVILNSLGHHDLQKLLEHRNYLTCIVAVEENGIGKISVQHWKYRAGK